MPYVRPLSPEQRALAEVRQDAKLLLWVVRERLGEGSVPLEHAAALARIAEDERISPRRRRRAAEYLARLALASIEAGS